MVTTLTSAIALSSRSVLAEEGLDPTDPANVAALAVVVGAVMLVFGLLRFGSIMNFVSQRRHDRLQHRHRAADHRGCWRRDRL